MNYKFILLIILLSFVSCDGPTIYKDATIVKHNNKFFIKVKGRASYMVHDPISIIFNKTYADSDSIPLPYLKNGVFKGSEIRFDEGTYIYTYNGYVSVYPKQAKINLYAYDTVNNQRVLSNFEWNGEYHLTNH